MVTTPNLIKNLRFYLEDTGLSCNQHLLIHASFRAVRKAFPNISIEQLLQTIKGIITSNGSLIIPGFSYCFKKSDNSHEIFIKENTKSKVGSVSEVFSQMDDTIRTSSPTHSFLLWGKITSYIPETNNPRSPLGKDSVLEWIANHKNTQILLLGADFSSLTFGHYIEIAAGLPWLEYSPWDHLYVEPYGVSREGLIKLEEIPGCSKSFKNFEQHLESLNLIQYSNYKGLTSILISAHTLLQAGIPFFKSNQEEILCPIGTCEPCDARWDYYLNKLKSKESE